jgi:hypothetical protein
VATARPLYRHARKDSPWFERGAFWLYRSASADPDWFARVEAGEDLSPQELTQNYCCYGYEPPIPTLGVGVNLKHEVVRVALANAPRDEQFRRRRRVVLDRAAELAEAPGGDWVPFGEGGSTADLGLIYMGAERLRAEPVTEPSP